MGPQGWKVCLREKGTSGRRAPQGRPPEGRPRKTPLSPLADVGSLFFAHGCQPQEKFPAHTSQQADSRRFPRRQRTETRDHLPVQLRRQRA